MVCIVVCSSCVCVCVVVCYDLVNRKLFNHGLNEFYGHKNAYSMSSLQCGLHTHPGHLHIVYSIDMPSLQCCKPFCSILVHLLKFTMLSCQVYSHVNCVVNLSILHSLQGVNCQLWPCVYLAMATCISQEH